MSVHVLDWNGRLVLGAGRVFVGSLGWGLPGTLIGQVQTGRAEHVRYQDVFHWWKAVDGLSLSNRYQLLTSFS